MIITIDLQIMILNFEYLFSIDRNMQRANIESLVYERNMTLDWEVWRVQPLRRGPGAIRARRAALTPWWGLGPSPKASTVRRIIAILYVAINIELSIRIVPAIRRTVF